MIKGKGIEAGIYLMREARLVNGDGREEPSNEAMQIGRGGRYWLVGWYLLLR